MYITDTHSLLWFLTGDNRLGDRSREIFRSCDKGEMIITIPSIVLLECLYVCEKKGTNLKFNQIIESLEGNYNYIVYPLDTEVVLNCENTALAEPHDRIIVATAKLLNAKVITKDDKIKTSKLVGTVW